MTARVSLQHETLRELDARLRDRWGPKVLRGGALMLKDVEATGKEAMTLTLTDEQARMLAACGLCSRPLPWRAVKRALENGDAEPPGLRCASCGPRVLPAGPAALKAALRILGRIEAAGLTGHYGGVAAVAGFPPRAGGG